MGKIAIDVVLLPSEEMTDSIIEVNRDLIDKTGDGSLVLHKQKCIPHITLFMGVIEEDKIEEINRIIKEVSEEYEPFSFNANTYTDADLFPGKNQLLLDFEYSHRFRDFRETLISKLIEKLSFEEVSKDMFIDPEEVNDSTVEFVKNYLADKRPIETYVPHITLGFGKSDILDLPMRFASSRLAVFQLGNYCTCKKPLGVYELIDN